MKVFLSWSGARSKAVAELLNDWLRCVLQACKPWISSRDVDRGTLWFGEISGQLSDTEIGIVCLTTDNRMKPWILFEAGALAKGLSHSRVCTLLIDLKPSDVEDPLAQFNHTFPERDSMWALVRTLNGCLQASAMDERILENVFNTYWPQFEREFAKIIKIVAPTEEPEKRSEQSVLVEILENTRSLGNRVRHLEAHIENVRTSVCSPRLEVDQLAEAIRHQAMNDYQRDRAAVLRDFGIKNSSLSDPWSEMRLKAFQEIVRSKGDRGHSSDTPNE